MLHALAYVPVFVLVVFRLAGMMLYAPLFGSARIPRRLKGAIVLVLALGMAPGLAPPVVLPQSAWQLALGIAGEIAFGLAMGMVMSFVFIAVEWAGAMIGQQMGLNMAEVLDPSMGGGTTIIGDLYYMMTLVVFLSIGGHRMMLQGVRESFDVLPLLSVGVNQSLFDLLTRLLEGATVLAMQLAAPVLVTMLVVDLVLGLIGRAVPQMNVMAMGLSLRSAAGMVVIIVSLTLAVRVMRSAVEQSMLNAWTGWTAPPAAVHSG
ncbi:MAG TPA: flagellar biosynthetic protein FliR [Tepidisphaeraceae bacterium]|nr:flagellar biosynthetic protein FliR [Tepidisphaeraceae bacterium]